MLLYHFDQVFTIFEISVSEKADKFSFDLWRILKVAFHRHPYKVYVQARNTAPVTVPVVV